MTKKHFIAIAANFKAQLIDIRAMKISQDEMSARLMTCWKSVNDFCDTARNENPRFDRQRFLTACGM